MSTPYKSKENPVNKVKNVVFDFGGVLISFDPLRYLQTLLQDESKAQEFYHSFIQSHEWVEMDRGTLSIEEAKQCFKMKVPKLTNEIDLFFNKWFDMFLPVEPVVGILESLHKQNIPVFAISNFIREMHDDLFPRFTFMKLFKGIVLSYRINHVKPEPEIYRHLVDTYNLCPEECVFIDDLEKNVQGAQAAGFKGIHFQSAAQLKNKLREYDIFLD